MKKYTTPEIEFVKLDMNDIICTSGGDLGIFTGEGTDIIQSPERLLGDDVMGWDLNDL